MQNSLDNCIIYTDGAYSSSRNQGGWAFVIISDGEKKYSEYDTVFNTTNNRMEIQSAIEAIRYMVSNNAKTFTIYSDSMYLIGTMTLNWKRKKYIDLWEIMDKLVKDLNIIWLHVKGHEGDKYNELCDTFAVHASKLKRDNE